MNIMIDGNDIFQLLHQAQKAAARAAEGMDDPAAEPMACLTILMIMTNMVLLSAGGVLTEEHHDTIRATSETAALGGIAVLQAADRARRATH